MRNDTGYLLSSPKNAEHLLAGISELRPSPRMFDWLRGLADHIQRRATVSAITLFTGENKADGL